MTAKNSPCGDCGTGNGERPPLAVLYHSGGGGRGRRRGAGAAAGAGPHCGRPHRRGGADPPPAPVVSGLHRIGGRAGIRPGERVDGIRPENHPRPAEPPDGKGGPPARRRAEPSGAGGAGVPLRGGRGHGGDPVHRRDHQYGGGRLPDPQYSDRGVAVQPGACLSAAGAAAGAVPLYPVRPEADAAQSAEKPEGGEPGLRICAGDGAESPHHPHAGQGDLHGDPV